MIFSSYAGNVASKKQSWDELLYYLIADIDLMIATLETMRTAIQSQLFTYARVGDVDFELHQWIQRKASACMTRSRTIYGVLYKHRKWQGESLKLVRK